MNFVFVPFKKAAKWLAVQAIFFVLKEVYECLLNEGVVF
jgi:hypothetical protein